MTDWEDLLPDMQDVAKWLVQIRQKGTFSIGFVRDVAWHQQTRTYHVHSIYDEISRLEGDRNQGAVTKGATPFKDETLSGLWHQHHRQPRFLLRNITQEINPRSFIQDALAPFVGMQIDENVSAQIAHAVVIGAYESRCRRGAITGEWIVFEPRPDGSHHYLTLAQHDEGNKAIAERVAAYRVLDQALSLPATDPD